MSARRANIAQRRLAAQHLTRAPFSSAVDAVRAQGAVQAQDYGGAKWALGLRCPRETDASIDRALAKGAIVRTHVLRPTWHIVDPADIRWMLALTAPRVKRTMLAYDRQLGLDGDTFERSNAVLRRALKGGVQMTRAEIGGVLRASGLTSLDSMRIGHLLLGAELDRVVISGARRGKQLTYALFDERVPETPALDREEALVRLATLYFGTRGPATAGDFAWWSGLTAGDAREGIRLAGGALESENVDGLTYWSAADAPRVRGGAPSAHLLPNYDEYFIGHRDRGAIMERVRSTPGANVDTLAAHVIEVGGQIVGGWKRAVKRGAVTITMYPIVKLTADERALIRGAAERHAEFLDLEPDVQWQKSPARSTTARSPWIWGVLR